MPPVKQQALLYLDATLAVLQREGIPLARPVHGKPARGARFIEIPINLDRQRVGPAAMRKIFNSGTISAIDEAKADPERFRDLVVRVAGYSAFFTSLSPDTQDDIIARTLSSHRD